MKGVSTVVLVIIILMIVVALSALAYTWFIGIYQTITQTGAEAIETASTAGQAMMKIESVSDNQIYIRNTGQVDLTDINVYVGDTAVSATVTPSIVPPGDVATITFTSAPSGDIKVTTGEGALSIRGNYPGYTDTFPKYSTSHSNPATYSSSTVTWMNVTWTDNKGISFVRTESNYSGLVNYTPTQSGDVYYLNRVLPAGVHRWRSFANDTVDQWNTTTTQTFTINKAASTVYLYINTTRSNKAYSINSIVNYTSQMSSPTTGNVELWTNYSNGVWKRWIGPAASPLVNLTNMTVAGVWNWTANYTGNQNYSADLETWNVTIT